MSMPCGTIVRHKSRAREATVPRRESQPNQYGKDMKSDFVICDFVTLSTFRNCKVGGIIIGYYYIILKYNIIIKFYSDFFRT